MNTNDVFRVRINELTQAAGDKAGAVVRMLALQMATAMVMRSPVDTGRFRANWQYGADSINTDAADDVDTAGSGTLSRISGELSSWVPGQTIYVTNSLPYARRLEYGHSQTQAPGGIVRVTVAEFGSHLDAAAQGVA